MGVRNPPVSCSLGGALAGLQPSNVEIGETLNAGHAHHDLTLTFPGEVIVSKEARASFAATCEGFERPCPPMVILTATPTRDAAGSTVSTSVKLMDEATWKMSKDGVSLPSFRRVFVSQILSALGQALGVEFVGSENWWVGEEDIRGKGKDAVGRIASAQVAFTKVDRYGRVQFVPMGASAGGGGWAFTNVSRGIDATRHATGVWCQKTSSIPGNLKLGPWTSEGNKVVALTTPIARGVAFDRSQSGYISFVGFWQGDPGQPGSLLVDYTWFVEPGIITVGTGSGPITHVSADVELPADESGIVAALLEVLVTPVANLPSGVEPEFRIAIGDVTTDSSRPAPVVMTEQLWPNRGFVLARTAGILLILRMDADPINVSGPLFLPLGLMEEVQPPNCPTGLVKSYKHSINVSGSTATTTAALIPKEAP